MQHMWQMWGVRVALVPAKTLVLYCVLSLFVNWFDICNCFQIHWLAWCFVLSSLIGLFFIWTSYIVFHQKRALELIFKICGGVWSTLLGLPTSPLNIWGGYFRKCPKSYVGWKLMNGLHASEYHITHIEFVLFLYSYWVLLFVHLVKYPFLIFNWNEDQSILAVLIAYECSSLTLDCLLGCVVLLLCCVWYRCFPWMCRFPISCLGISILYRLYID